MIILMPEKAFKKRIEKFVKYKDFIIADATDRNDGKMGRYGNSISTSEINVPPTLMKIAIDPDSEESKIKRRNIQKYLDNWLSYEGLELQIHYMVGAMLRAYSTTKEDLNIFLVMRTKVFYSYHEYLEDKINTDYGMPIATFITHKMDKDEVKKILKATPSKEDMKKLRKIHKQLGKSMDIANAKIIEGMDD